jgi:hypothetical protein
MPDSGGMSGTERMGPACGREAIVIDTSWERSSPRPCHTARALSLDHPTRPNLLSQSFLVNPQSNLSRRNDSFDHSVPKLPGMTRAPAPEDSFTWNMTCFIKENGESDVAGIRARWTTRRRIDVAPAASDRPLMMAASPTSVVVSAPRSWRGTSSRHRPSRSGRCLTTVRYHLRIPSNKLDGAIVDDCMDDERIRPGGPSMMSGWASGRGRPIAGAAASDIEPRWESRSCPSFASRSPG